MIRQEYEVGDLVCVLPYEEIEAQFESGRTLSISHCSFPKPMEKYCGKEGKITKAWLSEFTDGPDKWRYHIDLCDGAWCFTHGMLEPVHKPTLTLDVSITYDSIFEGV